MRIAFFGLQSSFDYREIGGMNSLTRRLGQELVIRGAEVDFVCFGAPNEKQETAPGGIRLRSVRDFGDGLDVLAFRYDHVVTIYIPPVQRLKYADFRQRIGDQMQFHQFLANWPESRLARMLQFLEPRLMPYNGFLFSISPRLHRYVSQWAVRSVLLLPPVPDEYFLRPEDKRRHDQLRLTYMGRIDPGKGTPAAITVLKHLSKNPEFETRICGYFWEHKLESIKLHRQLVAQNDIFYKWTKFEGYSPRSDMNVRQILQDTDALLLPYERLSSTIDMPLLLLEGMANLCVILTRPLGDLANVYGTDEWMLDEFTDPKQLERVLRKLRDGLVQEHLRLDRRNRELQFSTSEVVDQFCEALNSA